MNRTKCRTEKIPHTKCTAPLSLSSHSLPAKSLSLSLSLSPSSLLSENTLNAKWDTRHHQTLIVYGKVIAMITRMRDEYPPISFVFIQPRYSFARDKFPLQSYCSPPFCILPTPTTPANQSSAAMCAFQHTLHLYPSLISPLVLDLSHKLNSAYPSTGITTNYQSYFTSRSLSFSIPFCPSLSIPSLHSHPRIEEDLSFLECEWVAGIFSELLQVHFSLSLSLTICIHQQLKPAHHISLLFLDIHLRNDHSGRSNDLNDSLSLDLLASLLSLCFPPLAKWTFDPMSTHPHKCAKMYPFMTKLLISSSHR